MSLNAHQKLSKIQQEIKVGKSQYNAFGKYFYRSAEDILEAVKPFEKTYDVTFTVDEEIKSIETMEAPIVYVVAIATMIDNDSGSVVTARGNAIIDFEAKGMQMPQRTGAASSYSKKYALGNLLLLDDSKDPDATNNHDKGGAKPPVKSQPAPKPSLKTMTNDEKESFLKGIKEGKFASVEKYLSKYTSNPNKEAVTKALTAAKKGA
jgi:hypothetical protein